MKGAFSKVFLCMVHGKHGDLLKVHMETLEEIRIFQSTFCELEGCYLIESMYSVP